MTRQFSLAVLVCMVIASFFVAEYLQPPLSQAAYVTESIKIKDIQRKGLRAIMIFQHTVHRLQKRMQHVSQQIVLTRIIIVDVAQTDTRQFGYFTHRHSLKALLEKGSPCCFQQ